MSTQNTVWVVINCQQVTDRIRSLLDGAYFSEATKMSNDIKSFSNKIENLVSTKGGHLYVLLDDRQVMEIPLTVAEELPNIIEGYRNAFRSNLACGLGLTFDEAIRAVQKSLNTGEIEMHDPSSDTQYSDFDKSEPSFELSPNVFSQSINNPDSLGRKSKTPKKSNEDEYDPFTRLSPQQENANEKQFLQTIAETLGAPSQEQMQQQMMAQQQAQNPPRDLREALHGGAVQGYQPKEEQPKESEQGSSDSQQPEEDDEHDALNQKLGTLLSTVKEKLPQIMSLAESNPKVYEQAMKLVHKLVDVTKKKRKIDKSEAVLNEAESITEELNKALRFPVGAVHNRKKKVIVNGKAVWRSVISGLTMDNEGNAISTKSHNATAPTGGPPDIKKSKE
jgi:hypothetical protein